MICSFSSTPGKYVFHPVIFLLHLKRYKEAHCSGPQHQKSEGEKAICFCLVFKDATVISCISQKSEAISSLCLNDFKSVEPSLPNVITGCMCVRAWVCVWMGVLRQEEILRKRVHSVNFHDLLWSLTEFF